MRRFEQIYSGAWAILRTEDPLGPVDIHVVAGHID
jgi:hypothetical protein